MLSLSNSEQCEWENNSGIGPVKTFRARDWQRFNRRGAGALLAHNTLFDLLLNTILLIQIYLHIYSRNKMNSFSPRLM